MNAPSFLQAEITSDGTVVAATTSGSWSKEGKPFEGAVLGQRLEEAPKFSYQRTHRELYKLTPDYNSWLTDPASPLFKPVALEQTDHKNLIARRVKYPDYTIRRYTESLPNNVYKFECNSTGFIGAKFDVRTPSKIVFLWDELLTNGESNGACRSTDGWSTNWHRALHELESFEPYTLQYLQVIVEKGDCKVSDFYIRQYVNSDVARASFSCDNGGINKIYKAAVETYKQNALDIFMDCPSRERAGWLCDSYFTARVAFDLSGNHLIETNFLENYLLPEKFMNIPQGMLPMCYPSDHVNGNFIPNWAMWFVIELEEIPRTQQRPANDQSTRTEGKRTARLFRPIRERGRAAREPGKVGFRRMVESERFRPGCQLSHQHALCKNAGSSRKTLQPSRSAAKSTANP
ncbi:MAG: hypothetical protein ACLR8Y_12280 [Alistipes indistinctus]